MRRKRVLTAALAILAWCPFVGIIASALASWAMTVPRDAALANGHGCYWFDALLPGIACLNEPHLLESFLNAWVIVYSLRFIVTVAPRSGLPIAAAVLLPAAYLYWYHAVFRRRRSTVHQK